jgi:cysteine-rich repeat protein
MTLAVRKKIFFFGLLLLVGAAFWGTPAWAQDFGLTEIGEQSGLGNESLVVTIARIIRVIIGVIGLVLLGLVLYAGWLWLTAAGDSEKIAKAKKILISAVIGLIIIFSSFALASFIINMFAPGGGTTSEPCDPQVDTVRSCGSGGCGTQICQSSGYWSWCNTSNCPPITIASQDAYIKSFSSPTFANWTEYQNLSYGYSGTVKAPNLQDLTVGAYIQNLGGGIGNSVLQERKYQVVTTEQLPQEFNDYGQFNPFSSSDETFNTQTKWDVSDIGKYSLQSKWLTRIKATAAGSSLTSDFFQKSPTLVKILPAHCFNGEKDEGETGIDCGGQEQVLGDNYCGACAGEKCNSDTSESTCKPNEDRCRYDCDNTTCICVGPPTIDYISPAFAGPDGLQDFDQPETLDDDVPNGAPGNYVTIWGKFFGTAAGEVWFVSKNNNSKRFLAPLAPCSHTWNRNQIIVVLPDKHSDGTTVDQLSGQDLLTNYRVYVSSFDSGLTTLESDAKDFQLNNIQRPGICEAYNLDYFSANNVKKAFGQDGDKVQLLGNKFPVADNNGDVVWRFRSIRREFNAAGQIWVNILQDANVTSTATIWQSDSAAQDEVPPNRRGQSSLGVYRVDFNQSSNYFRFLVSPGGLGDSCGDASEPGVCAASEVCNSDLECDILGNNPSNISREPCTCWPKLAACDPGQVQACQLGQCSGNQTCQSNGAWGVCQPLNPQCVSYGALGSATQGAYAWLFNTTDVGVGCGNNQLDEGEFCDLVNGAAQFAQGSSCSGYGSQYGAGTVGCSVACQGDFSGCVSVVPVTGTIGSATQGAYAWLFNTLSEAEIPETELCGNGQIDAGESCDGELFASGQSTDCADYGMGPGTVSCDRTCKLKFNCSGGLVGSATQGAYAWAFTTLYSDDPDDAAPHVIEDCSRDKNCQAGQKLPSPTPWSEGWNDSQHPNLHINNPFACLDVVISARFSTPMDEQTITSDTNNDGSYDNIGVLRCTASTEALCMAENSTYWAPITGTISLHSDNSDKHNDYFRFLPTEPLTANTFYKVVLTSGLRSETGVAFNLSASDQANLNQRFCQVNGINNAVYCWNFRTRTAADLAGCRPGCPECSPDPHTMWYPLSNTDYQADIDSQDNQCLLLKPSLYSWDWSTDKADKILLYQTIWSDPWHNPTEDAVALKQTIFDTPNPFAKVFVQLTDNPGKKDYCRAYNDFSNPVVIEDASCDNVTQSPTPWKNSQDACTNAMISGRFSRNMQNSSLSTATIKLQKCNSGVAAAFDNSFCQDIVYSSVKIFDYTPVLDDQIRELLEGAQATGATANYLTQLTTLLQDQSHTLPEGFILERSGDLNNNTWYRVIIIGGGSGVRGALTTNDTAAEGILKRTNCDYNNGSVNYSESGRDYCWKFKTADKKCSISKVVVTPQSLFMAFTDASRLYNAWPLAANCNLLNPSSYTWNWRSLINLSDDAVEGNTAGGSGIGVAAICPADAAAACSYASTLAAPQVKIFAQGDGQTNIKARAVGTRSDSSWLNDKWGFGQLFIGFNQLRVAEQWPSCQGVNSRDANALSTDICLNASLGVRFNLDIRSAQLTSDLVKLYQNQNNVPIDIEVPRDAGETDAWPQLTNQIQFTPENALTPNTEYRVVIKGGPQGIRAWNGKELGDLNYNSSGGGKGEECEPSIYPWNTITGKCSLTCMLTGNICGTSFAECGGNLNAMVTYLKFNGSVLDAAYDNGRQDGTATNLNYVNGKFGLAAKLDGESSGVSLPQNFTMSREYGTISIWARPEIFNKNDNDSTTFTAGHLIYGCGDAYCVDAGYIKDGFGGEAGFNLSVVNSNNAPKFQFYLGSQTLNNNPGNLPTYGLMTPSSYEWDKWYHLAVIYDLRATASEKAIKMFVNGQLVASQPATNPINMVGNFHTVFIGRPPANIRYFKGELDELKLFQGVLSEAEVRALYNQKKEDDSANYCNPNCHNTGNSNQASCGDGVIMAGEECDDGNANSNDGCNSSCLLEGSNQRWGSLCGNNRLETGEGCDVGNSADTTDGCSASCLVENGWRCTNCSNANYNTKETCEAADCGGGNKCVWLADKVSTCVTLSNALRLPGSLAQVPICGNNKIEVGEDCDDGNKTSGDGCSAICLNEGSSSGAVCGNQLVEKGQPDSYSWVFKTKADNPNTAGNEALCALGRVEVEPLYKAVKGVGKLDENHRAAPYGQADACQPVTGQRLNCLLYQWTWNVVPTDDFYFFALYPALDSSCWSLVAVSDSATEGNDGTVKATENKGTAEAPIFGVACDGAGGRCGAVDVSCPYQYGVDGDSVCGSTDQGVGADGCCHYKPDAVKVGSFDICTNAILETQFAAAELPFSQFPPRGVKASDQPILMDASSLLETITQNNKTVYKNIQLCLPPTAWQPTSFWPQPDNFLALVTQKVKRFFGAFFGWNNSAIAYSNWDCPAANLVDIEVKSGVYANDSGQGTALQIIPKQILQSDEDYKLIIKKDVKSRWGLPMLADRVFSFKTIENHCNIDHLEISRNADYFFCAGNDCGQNTPNNSADDDESAAWSTPVDYGYLADTNNDAILEINPLDGNQHYYWIRAKSKENQTLNAKFSWEVAGLPLVALNALSSVDNLPPSPTPPASGMFIGGDRDDFITAWQQKLDYADESDPADNNNSNIFISAARPKSLKGDTLVKVKAKSNLAILNLPEVSADIPVTIFLCNNPWPAAANFPFKDSSNNCSSGPAANCLNTNFSTFYCRDRGSESLADDLPALSPVAIAVSYGRTGDNGLVKEFLWPRADNNKEVIGIRVFKNTDHYSPVEWYRAVFDPQHQGNPSSLIVDDYQAIREGRTTYVSAADASDKKTDGTASDSTNNAQLYTNVYLISYSENANQDTLDIYNQLVDNLRFNVGALDQEGLSGLYGECSEKLACSSDADCAAYNLGTCSSGRCDNNYRCLTDSDCRQFNLGYCSSAKAKLTRDTKRLADIQDINFLLQNYYSKKRCSNDHKVFCSTDASCYGGGRCGNYYPTLSSGSYVPSRSYSVWPSWQATLGNTLGSALPVDPINKFFGCPTSYDAVTCWNESAKRLGQPADAYVYTYLAYPGASGLPGGIRDILAHAELTPGGLRWHWESGISQVKLWNQVKMIGQNTNHPNVFGSFNINSIGSSACGNGSQDAGENCYNCPNDFPCASGMVCQQESGQWQCATGAVIPESDRCPIGTCILDTDGQPKLYNGVDTYCDGDLAGSIIEKVYQRDDWDCDGVFNNGAQDQAPDVCPWDSNRKWDVGQCGCGGSWSGEPQQRSGDIREPNSDNDEENIPDCIDSCPLDPNKSEPGICGCGLSDVGDRDFDGIPDACDSPKCGDKLVEAFCSLGDDEDYDTRVECETLNGVWLYEQCDDGNNAPGDGCSAACRVENGWKCTNTSVRPSVCYKACGDGIIDNGETCDCGSAADYPTTGGAVNPFIPVFNPNGNAALKCHSPNNTCQGAYNPDYDPSDLMASAFSCCYENCTKKYIQTDYFCGDGTVTKPAEVCDIYGGLDTQCYGTATGETENALKCKQCVARRGGEVGSGNCCWEKGDGVCESGCGEPSAVNPDGSANTSGSPDCCPYGKIWSATDSRCVPMAAGQACADFGPGFYWDPARGPLDQVGQPKGMCVNCNNARWYCPPANLTGLNCFYHYQCDGACFVGNQINDADNADDCRLVPNGNWQELYGCTPSPVDNPEHPSHCHNDYCIRIPAASACRVTDAFCGQHHPPLQSSSFPGPGIPDYRVYPNDPAGQIPGDPNDICCTTYETFNSDPENCSIKFGDVIALKAIKRSDGSSKYLTSRVTDGQKWLVTPDDDNCGFPSDTTEHCPQRDEIFKIMPCPLAPSPNVIDDSVLSNNPIALMRSKGTANTYLSLIKDNFCSQTPGWYIADDSDGGNPSTNECFTIAKTDGTTGGELHENDNVWILTGFEHNWGLFDGQSGYLFWDTEFSGGDSVCVAQDSAGGDTEFIIVNGREAVRN